MKKSNGRPIHMNVLHPSTMDVVMLGDATEERFKIVLGRWFRAYHVEIVPPSELDRDMELWRTMRIRHREGDYRNTDDELRATQRIADWTHMKNCEVCNQKYTPIKWGN